jgi:hypothetical protein
MRELSIIVFLFLCCLIIFMVFGGFGSLGLKY